MPTTPLTSRHRGNAEWDLVKCDRCGADEPVERYEVDGFTGRLCADCLEVWDEIESE